MPFGEQQEVEDGDVDTFNGEIGTEDAADLAEADEAAARLRWLREAVEKLDPLDRALVLLYLEGNPHDAIADVLGLSVSNVGTKLGRDKNGG